MDRRADEKADTEMPEQETVSQGEVDAQESAAEEGAHSVESTHPTSSDVGKQTLTKADLGYDVTKEGVPDDEEALATPQHPDDPSAYEESSK